MMSRFESLATELESADKVSDASAIPVIGEAVNIFDAAISRLSLLRDQAGALAKATLPAQAAGADIISVRI